MAHSRRQHPINGKVINLTNRTLHTYTNTGDIITLEPSEKDDSQHGVYYVVELDEYHRARDNGEDTSHLAGASPAEQGRDGQMIVAIARYDGFVRVYPVE